MIQYSEQFLKNWKEILKELYGYKEYEEFLIVPSLLFSKTYVSLPLLNYSKKVNLEVLKNNSFQMRILNSDYHEFIENDPVTMRLELSENVFHTTITSKCRNQIRKSEKSDLDLKVGKEELLEDFFLCFRDTMNRYGTPVFDKKLFQLVLKKIEANIIIVYKEGVVAAGLIVIFDKNLAFVPWAGSNPSFSKLCPNHAIYWKAIKLSLDKGVQVFDFGRSPFKGATYSFKRQWGAKPIKIDIIRDKEEDIYSKYSIVSKIYKLLPNSVTNLIGPKLCKFLADL